jgi:capsular polysaccharide biosynthesis protein
MAETFEPLEYLNFLATRWKFAVVCVGTALVVAAAVCLFVPNQYTATATLLIEPAAASDPRTGTAVSPIYLESLKSYEQFAASDSQFLKACEKFGLLTGANPPAVESLKRRVLRVDKLKDTKVLQISVTLTDPHNAQAVAQYLAEETAALNRSIALDNDRRALGALRAQLEEARTTLTKVRLEQARVMAQVQPALWQEIRALADVLQGLEERSSEAAVETAELTARQGVYSPSFPEQEDVRGHLAGTRARQKQLDLERAAIQKHIAEKTAELAAIDVRKDTANAQLSSAEVVYRDLEKREADLSASAGLRTEQLRIVDPGIVPQRPSFPNPALILAAALLLSLMATLAWLTLLYGLARQNLRLGPRELRVARSASR